MNSFMRTLIYKRTHPGDPDAKGRFGIYDCMGRVRAWDFEAVIGWAVPVWNPGRTGWMAR